MAQTNLHSKYLSSIKKKRKTKSKRKKKSQPLFAQGKRTNTAYNPPEIIQRIVQNTSKKLLKRCHRLWNGPPTTTTVTVTISPPPTLCPTISAAPDELELRSSFVHLFIFPVFIYCPGGDKPVDWHSIQRSFLQYTGSWLSYHLILLFSSNRCGIESCASVFFSF